MSKTDKASSLEINLHGQTIGRKGQQNRERLLAAARSLLNVYSPVDLTAVAIAREAGTSSASFYMYFEDTSDILYSLAVEASAAMSSVHDVVRQTWAPDSVKEHALLLVDCFNEIWTNHRQILRYRNLEADRGDPRFEALRMSTYVPFIDLLARQIVASTPKDKLKPTLGQAFALASVLHAAMERLASTDPAVVARGVGSHKVNDALAHTIRLVFDSGAPDIPQAAPVRPAARKPLKKAD